MWRLQQERRLGAPFTAANFGLRGKERKRVNRAREQSCPRRDQVRGEQAERPGVAGWELS